MKTKEELNVLKEEVETLSKKLAKLTEEEIAQISGGWGMHFGPGGGQLGAEIDHYPFRVREYDN